MLPEVPATGACGSQGQLSQPVGSQAPAIVAGVVCLQNQLQRKTGVSEVSEGLSIGGRSWTAGHKLCVWCWLLGGHMFVSIFPKPGV